MNNQADPVNVLCIKWGNKYGSDYVNTLYSMVSRNLSRPFRFICLTDDNEGIRDEVEVKPIPKIGFEDFDKQVPWTKAHGWLKLTCFANPLHDLSGQRCSWILISLLSATWMSSLSRKVSSW